MAKILIYDLEVSPILGWVYQRYDARVLKVEQESFIMSISWRWYGEDEIHHFGGVRTLAGERRMARKIRELLHEADIVIAHNANRFDNRVAMGCIIKHGIAPPSSYRTIDTLRVARGVARFSSNSLNDLCELFGIGVKSEITHSDLWHKCLNGDAEAWKLMEEYNNQDVELLTQLYEKLRPYIRNHPNLGDINQQDKICPKCASLDLNPEGTHARRAGRVQSYSCGNCGGWCNDNTVKRTGGRMVND